MDIRTIKPSQVAKELVDLLIIPHEKILNPDVKKYLPGIASEIVRLANIEPLGKEGSMLQFYPAGQSIAKRVIVVKVGNDVSTSIKNLKRFIARHGSVAVIAPTKNTSKFTEAIIKLAFDATYTFPHFKSQQEDTKKLKTLCIVSNTNLQKTVATSYVEQEAVTAAKHLGNLPANKLTPASFAEQVSDMAKNHNLQVTVLGETEMKTLGMGGVLAVSQGSTEEAKVIILEHNTKAKKTIGIVGKGITFDSGGISMKEAKAMTDMKYDMCGGATVAAVLQAAADLQVPYHVVGIIGAAENLPSGNAIKPRDVIHMMNGKTVEVINTDAEGRLVLADCLTYLQQHYKPNVLIDIATLTGAVIQSLGNKISGVMGNNDKLIKALIDTGKESGETIWQLPLFDAYKEDLRSKTADLTNLGPNRWDALVAAIFLKEFVDPKIPWMHIDIAGTAFNSEGATGAMVTPLLQLLSHKKL